MMESCQRCMLEPNRRSSAHSISSHTYSLVMAKQKVNSTTKKGESLFTPTRLFKSHTTEKLSSEKTTPPVACSTLSYKNTWS